MNMNVNFIFKTKKVNLILIAGIVWLAAGVNIMRIGILADVQLKYWIVLLGIATFIAFGSMFYKITVKHTMRIMQMQQDKVCVFRFFDLKSYILMTVMMSSGILCRKYGVFPLWFIKGFYSGLGTALSLSGVLLIIDFVKEKIGIKHKQDQSKNFSTNNSDDDKKSFPENTFVLPEDFVEIQQINLLTNKKQLLTVNGIALLIAVIMFVGGAFLHPFSIGIVNGAWKILLVKIIIFLLLVVVYMILHELVHGFFIKKFSGKKADYGFGLGYAYAGSKAYFNKKSYIIIALAPIIVWGIVLLVFNILFPGWFWVIYGIQILNVSGAAGDFFVTYKVLKLSKDILVKDSGTSMIVYQKAN